MLDSLCAAIARPCPTGAAFVQADLLDAAALAAASSRGFDGVLHFAALALVAESVATPSATTAATSSAR